MPHKHTVEWGDPFYPGGFCFTNISYMVFDNITGCFDVLTVRGNCSGYERGFQMQVVFGAQSCSILKNFGHLFSEWLMACGSSVNTGKCSCVFVC